MHGHRCRRSAALRSGVAGDEVYGRVMRQRFTYSRWDGTQTGFEFDADAAFDELTDELLYHGDVNAALRRMLPVSYTHLRAHET